MCLGCMLTNFFPLTLLYIRIVAVAVAVYATTVYNWNTNGIIGVFFCTYRHNGMEMRFENIHTDRLLNVQLYFNSNRHEKSSKKMKRKPKHTNRQKEKESEKTEAKIEKTTIRRANMWMQFSCSNKQYNIFCEWKPIFDVVVAAAAAAIFVVLYNLGFCIVR